LGTRLRLAPGERKGAPATGRQALGEATNGTYGTDVTYAT